MKRRLKKALKISAEDAQRVLHVLLSEGKLAAADVARAIQRREKLIREIRERLAQLGAEGFELASRVGRAARTSATNARARRRGARRAKRVLSAAARAAYRAQGRYMAAVRVLPKTARAKIKAIRAKAGVDAAIRAAKAIASK